MMTDIKGFTNKTSGYSRDQIEELLRSHEQLLTPFFAKHDGTVIKTIGDAFLVTFESTSDALQAGIEIQRALAENNAKVNEEEELHVRVAVNAGEVNLREGDIFGEPVNITARVESISKAGHVTFTDAVRLQLKKDSYPYKELGEVSLKGIPKPINLYRIVNDWAVDPSESGEISNSSKVKDVNSAYDADQIRDRKNSNSTYVIGSIVLILILIGLYSFNSKPSALAKAEGMLKNGRYIEALPVIESILQKVPSNKKLLAMREDCQIQVVNLHLEGDKIDEAITTGVNLLKQTDNDKIKTATTEALFKAIAITVKKAESSDDHTYAAKCLTNLSSYFKKHLIIMRHQIHLDMLKLSKVYEAGLSKQPEGATIVLKTLREQSFEPTINSVRKKIAINPDLDRDGAFRNDVNTFIPMLDYYEAARLIIKATTITPTEWMGNALRASDKAEKVVNLLAQALENDEELRNRQELKSGYVTLLKFFKTDSFGSESDTTIRFRRTIATFVIDWMAPVLAVESLKKPDINDGTKASEAAYRIRHNSERILKAAGKLDLFDKKAALRLDFAWFKKYKSNDSHLRKRIKICHEAVVKENNTKLTTEFESVIEDLKKRLKLSWGEK